MSSISELYDAASTLRRSVSVENIHLNLAERSGDFVLDDLDFGSIADHRFTLFYSGRAPNLDTDGRIKFQCPAPGRRLGITEHNTDLFPKLIDKDETGIRT